MQLYKKYRFEGLNAYRAAIKAGYSHATAIGAYRNIEKRINFDDLLLRAGLDNETILKVLSDGLVATKVVSAIIKDNEIVDNEVFEGKAIKESDKKNVELVEVPDFNVRHRYLETLLKLRGELKEIVEKHVKEKVVIIREKIIEKVPDGDQSQTGRLPRFVSVVKE